MASQNWFLHYRMHRKSNPQGKQAAEAEAGEDKIVKY
jgi:hypothetical protein